jgi:hypothetical protein
MPKGFSANRLSIGPPSQDSIGPPHPLFRPAWKCHLVCLYNAILTPEFLSETRTSLENPAKLNQPRHERLPRFDSPAGCFRHVEYTKAIKRTNAQKTVHHRNFLKVASHPFRLAFCVRQYVACFETTEQVPRNFYSRIGFGSTINPDASNRLWDLVGVSPRVPRTKMGNSDANSRCPDSVRGCPGSY